MDRLSIELSSNPNVIDAPVGPMDRSQLPDVIELSGQPSSVLFPAEQSAASATREEVVANNRSRAGAVAWRDVSPFLPDMVDADPLTVLTAMQERLSSDPTEENSDLLQAAINQIIASPELRRHHADAVQKAKQVFHETAGHQQSPIADNIWYEAYADPNFGGPEFFTSMTPNWGYWRQPDFRNVKSVYSSATAQDVVSSVEFGSSANETGGQVIFFEHIRYGGRYRNFSVPRGGHQRIPWIPDFNDLASSALIVRRFPNELPPISVAQNLGVPPVSSFVGTLPGLTADGNPIYTWDMWPGGGTGHPNDVNKIFIHIIVPMRLRLRVKVGLLPFDVDYRLEAKYWIYPFVRDGRLAANVDYYGWYIEAGILASIIAGTLKQRIASSVPTVQNGINAAVARIAIVAPRLSFCYLLPGRNDERGDVRDDVTLVAVR
jgi:hypothetical protein